MAPSGTAWVLLGWGVLCLLGDMGSTSAMVHRRCGIMIPRRFRAFGTRGVADPLRMKGGAVEAEDNPDKWDPLSWGEGRVQNFLDEIRGKLGDKTDHYKASFKDNNVDGAILLKLDTSKLESIGVKSLGHREHILDAIQNLRGQHGLPRGPTKADFEAARRAEMAPPKNPPKLLSKEDKKPVRPEGAWEGIERYAWDQEGNIVELFVTLDGVEGLPKESVGAMITEWGVELRAKGLEGKNWLFKIDKLNAKIRPDQSFWKVKPGMVHFKLRKDKGEEQWLGLRFDMRQAQREKEIKDKNADPENSLMNLMKDMYEDGDSSTRQMMAKAWHSAKVKSHKENPKEPVPPDMPF